MSSVGLSATDLAGLRAILSRPGRPRHRHRDRPDQCSASSMAKSTTSPPSIETLAAVDSSSPPPQLMSHIEHIRDKDQPMSATIVPFGQQIQVDNLTTTGITRTTSSRIRIKYTFKARPNSSPADVRSSPRCSTAIRLAVMSTASPTTQGKEKKPPPSRPL